MQKTRYTSSGLSVLQRRRWCQRSQWCPRCSPANVAPLRPAPWGVLIGGKSQVTGDCLRGVPFQRRESGLGCYPAVRLSDDWVCALACVAESFQVDFIMKGLAGLSIAIHIVVSSLMSPPNMPGPPESRAWLIG